CEYDNFAIIGLISMDHCTHRSEMYKTPKDRSETWNETTSFPSESSLFHVRRTQAPDREMPVRSAWHIHTCKITDEKDQSTNKRSTKNINRHACATLAPTDHKLIILEKKKEVIERRSVHGSAPGGRGVGLDGAGRV
uniref:Uncharacterized protein n=1 Tax=Aegilops tauschii subsp. strangulata TaxID=200361 RepID=A0A453L202_AEGTS